MKVKVMIMIMVMLWTPSNNSTAISYCDLGGYSDALMIMMILKRILMLMLMLIKMVYKLQQFHNHSLEYHDTDLGGDDDSDVYDVAEDGYEDAAG